MSDVEVLSSPGNTSASSIINDNDIDVDINRLTHLRTKPLTLRQERRLVSYLDDEFLQLTRGFKKRTSATTHVPTLHKYIYQARKLLSFILQIPPVEPSQDLRTQFMLRLTGDVLGSIPGYSLISRNIPSTSEDRREGEGEEPRDYSSALRELLNWLDDLDESWLVILQSQVWDPDLGEGVDLVLPTAPNEHNTQEITSGPISQTDVTRLRSLLITGIASLEEWLSQARGSAATATNTSTGEDDVAGMLERLGLLDEFDELFSRTMDFLGGFGGEYVGESDEDMIEVEMS